MTTDRTILFRAFAFLATMALVCCTVTMQDPETKGDDTSGITDTAPDVDPITDADGDGYAASIDCDDTDPAIGAEPAVWLDNDGDGYGDADHPLDPCLEDSHAVENNEDCDDDDPDVHPGVVWYADTDGDGFGDRDETTMSCVHPFGYVADDDDCDDTDNMIYPGATEVCDDADQDCDGIADNDAIDMVTWYPDADGDGYGSCHDKLSVTACDPASIVGDPDAWSTNDLDCNDANYYLYPGADDAFDCALWYDDLCP